MAIKDKDPSNYFPPKPRQSAAPADEASLPRIGGTSPANEASSLPRLVGRNGKVEITKGGRGPGAE